MTEEPEAAAPNDADSSLGDDDTASYTTSLASSVLDYQYENGRRYHKLRAGTYWGPNDEAASDEMDLNMHITLIATGGRLHLAPLSPSADKILDLGTGTGLWAIQMGDEYPSITVIGNDLSPIQPSIVPPNVQFEVDDFCDTWTYPPASFDLIHANQILGCVDDYPKFYSQILTALKPGGWYEHKDIDPQIFSDDGSHLGTAFETFATYNIEAGEKINRIVDVAPKMKKMMEEAGFINVKEEVFDWPIGAWPTDEKAKRLGEYHALAWDLGVESWILRNYTQVLNWTPAEVKVYCAKIRKAYRDPKVHAYQKLVICHGQKPE